MNTVAESDDRDVSMKRNRKRCRKRNLRKQITETLEKFFFNHTDNGISALLSDREENTTGLICDASSPQVFATTRVLSQLNLSLFVEKHGGLGWLAALCHPSNVITMSDDGRTIGRNTALAHRNERTIFVDNLPTSVDKASLERHFGVHGAVLKMDMGNLKKGFCFVEFASTSAFQSALTSNTPQAQGVNPDGPDSQPPASQTSTSDDPTVNTGTSPPSVVQKSTSDVPTVNTGTDTISVDPLSSQETTMTTIAQTIKKKRKTRRGKRESAAERKRASNHRRGVSLSRAKLVVLSRNEWKELRDDYLAKQKEGCTAFKKLINSAKLKFRKRQGFWSKRLVRGRDKLNFQAGDLSLEMV